jgi:hypothetical protein
MAWLKHVVKHMDDDALHDFKGWIWRSLRYHRELRGAALVAVEDAVYEQIMSWDRDKALAFLLEQFLRHLVPCPIDDDLNDMAQRIAEEHGQKTSTIPVVWFNDKAFLQERW